jgi:hypothetical protein
MEDLSASTDQALFPSCSQGTTMANEFEILAGFLAKFGDEVEGREMQEPPKHVQAQIHALARGALSESERTQLFNLLNENPQWLGRLADEVKSLRPEANRG